MSGLPSVAVNLYQSSADPEHKLGELHVDEFGRKFRYAQAGAAALVTGHLLQEAAEDTNYRSMAVDTAAAIGTFEVSVTLGGTAVTANQFDNGDLVVESSTGIGQQFKIERHDVQTSTTGSCSFFVERPIAIALTTSSQVSVRKSSYDGVIDFPVTPTGAPVGVATFAVPATEYAWIQSGGDVAVLYDDQANSAADESGLIPSRDLAGAVAVNLETIAAGVHIGWGREQVSTDSTMGFAKLIID